MDIFGWGWALFCAWGGDEVTEKEDGDSIDSWLIERENLLQFTVSRHPTLSEDLPGGRTSVLRTTPE